jgi:hypothetical protein
VVVIIWQERENNFFYSHKYSIKAAKRIQIFPYLLILKYSLTLPANHHSSLWKSCEYACIYECTQLTWHKFNRKFFCNRWPNFKIRVTFIFYT